MTTKFAPAPEKDTVCLNCGHEEIDHADDPTREQFDACPVNVYSPDSTGQCVHCGRDRNHHWRRYAAECCFAPSYRVELTYFKGTGKYYTGGEYVTEHVFYWDILAEIKQQRASGNWPGLSGACPSFHTLVTVPDHPLDVPHLIPATATED